MEQREREKKKHLTFFVPNSIIKRQGKKSRPSVMCVKEKKVKGSRFMDTNTNGRDRDSYTHTALIAVYIDVYGWYSWQSSRISRPSKFFVFCFLFFKHFLIERRILWRYNNHRFFHVCCISLFLLNENVRDAENFRGFL